MCERTDPSTFHLFVLICQASAPQGSPASSSKVSGVLGGAVPQQVFAEGDLIDFCCVTHIFCHHEALVGQRSCLSVPAIACPGLSSAPAVYWAVSVQCPTHLRLGTTRGQGGLGRREPVPGTQQVPPKGCPGYTDPINPPVSCGLRNGVPSPSCHSPYCPSFPWGPGVWPDVLMFTAVTYYSTSPPGFLCHCIGVYVNPVLLAVPFPAVFIGL